MELTNLIWHLGALLAALWAAFAYRALLTRSTELEQGVLASLLDHSVDGPATQADGGQERMVIRRRSVRTRALRWFVDEFARRRSVVVEWQDLKSLVQMSEQQWQFALGSLLESLNDLNRWNLRNGHHVVLQWRASETVSGEWVLTDKNAKDEG